MSFCAGFHHAAVQVADVERVAAFYREVLEMPELRRHHYADGRLRSIWLGLGGGQEQAGFLAIEEATDRGVGPLGWSMIALRVDVQDKPRIEALLHSRGVPIERRTGFTLYLRDPEGNLVGLSHYPNGA